MVISRYFYFLLIIFLFFENSKSQSFDNFIDNINGKFNRYKSEINNQFADYRDECNEKYANFLLSGWQNFDKEEPLILPKLNPIPPIFRDDKNKKQDPIVVVPEPIVQPNPKPKPEPIAPIPVNPISDNNIIKFDFFGNKMQIRIPDHLELSLNNLSPNAISSNWKILSSEKLNNTICDCLEIRKHYNLSDWAYLLFLDKLGKNYTLNSNEAILLTSFIYCQSGYQIRLAVDNDKLKLLFGSEHQIYNHPYYTIDGIRFYPYGDTSNSITICNAKFEGERPLSLIIDKQMKIGGDISNIRIIKSKKYPEISIPTQVKKELLNFYNTYPSSEFDNNMLTRWAMYANVPMSIETKEIIYPKFSESFENSTKFTIANKILNWVQTGFEYEYDDKVWGYDRAFFSEETLYYPYADCEDRAILFSRLIRDLLDLDVALVYYPNHLATAVEFNENIAGDAILINNRKFIICDPTYIGATVGMQMPGLNYNKTQAIILKK